jgi:hypothetical protein
MRGGASSPKGYGLGRKKRKALGLVGWLRERREGKEREREID